MNRIAQFFLVTVFAASAFAQAPTVATGGILNHYSFSPPGLPNGGIAQGSIFDIYGNNLGPATIAQFSGFPIPTSISGASVQVTVAGTTVDVYLFFVLKTQIVGILPSKTPIGTGTLTVTVNGQKSAAAPITVVARSIGILSLNQAGEGPAAMQIPDSSGNVPLNSITNSIKPGQVGVFYGTGAGAVTFDESRAAPLQDLSGDFHAYVGGIEAKIGFKGRTPGLVGLDQFNVEIPSGLSGCYVSVFFVTSGIYSNFTTISIANGSACPDPPVAAPTTGILRYGSITLSRLDSKSVSPSLPGGVLNFKQDIGTAGFGAIDQSKITPGPTTTPIYIGPCLVFVIKQSPPGPDNSASLSYFDAGPVINVKGPAGAKQLTKLATGYIAQPTLGGGPDIPFAPAPLPLYITTPGTYTFDNGAGGKDVGAFTVTADVQPPVLWTNEGATDIPRTGYDVTWTGGPPGSLVTIAGTSTIPGSSNGVGFSCNTTADPGHFLIPAQVLTALPPSAVVQGVPTGNLTVYNQHYMKTFAAPGIDQTLSYVTFVLSYARNVKYN